MEPPARESTLTLRLRAAKEFELSGKTNGPDWKRHEARIWDEREYRSGLVGARLEGIARGREAAFDEGFKEGLPLGRAAGGIRTLQEALSLPVTPLTELCQRPLAELESLLAELRAKYFSYADAH